MGRKPSQSSLQQPKMTAQQTCRPKVEPQITGRQGWAAALKQQQAQAQLQRADGRDGDEGGGRDGGQRTGAARAQTARGGGRRWPRRRPATRRRRAGGGREATTGGGGGRRCGRAPCDGRGWIRRRCGLSPSQAAPLSASRRGLLPRRPSSSPCAPRVHACAAALLPLAGSSIGRRRGLPSPAMRLASPRASCLRAGAIPSGVDLVGVLPPLLLCWLQSSASSSVAPPSPRRAPPPAPVLDAAPFLAADLPANQLLRTCCCQFPAVIFSVLCSSLLFHQSHPLL